MFREDIYFSYGEGECSFTKTYSISLKGLVNSRSSNFCTKLNLSSSNLESVSGLIYLQPHVDFGLKLLGADAMSIPGLYRFVQVCSLILLYLPQSRSQVQKTPNPQQHGIGLPGLARHTGLTKCSLSLLRDLRAIVQERDLPSIT